MPWGEQCAGQGNPGEDLQIPACQGPVVEISGFHWPSQDTLAKTSWTPFLAAGRIPTVLTSIASDRDEVRGGGGQFILMEQGQPPQSWLILRDLGGSKGDQGEIKGRSKGRLKDSKNYDKKINSLHSNPSTRNFCRLCDTFVFNSFFPNFV